MLRVFNETQKVRHVASLSRDLNQSMNTICEETKDKFFFD